MTIEPLSLFLSFLQIGAGSIGGGYAVISQISRQAVELHGWITAQEFTDIIAISQMTPGPLAVNTSTFVGLRTGGFSGACAATLGCVLPGVLIALFLFGFFSHFGQNPIVASVLRLLRAVSAGLIAAAAATILQLVFAGGSGLSDSGFPLLLFILCGSFLALRKYHASPMLIMTGSAAMGIAALLMDSI